jgi:hypothetical protein
MRVGKSLVNIEGHQLTDEAPSWIVDVSVLMDQHWWESPLQTRHRHVIPGMITPTDAGRVIEDVGDDTSIPPVIITPT